MQTGTLQRVLPFDNVYSYNAAEPESTMLSEGICYSHAYDKAHCPAAPERFRGPCYVVQAKHARACIG